MKNLQSVLTIPGIQKDLENIKQEDKSVIKKFTQDIVNLMGTRDWGQFLIDGDEWVRALENENEKFYREKKIPEKIEEVLNYYFDLPKQKDVSMKLKMSLIWLTAKIMLESRLAIHNLTRPESDSPGIGNPLPEAAYLDSM